MWIAYAWLLAFTPFISWTAWSRYKLRAELDESTTGYVIREHHSSGRSSSHSVEVGFTIDGRIFYVAGSTEDAELDDVGGSLVNREVTVYYSKMDPSRASLTRGARYQEVAGAAGAFILASLVATYWMLQRWRRRRSVIPEATVVHE